MKRTRIALAFAVLMAFATATAQNIPARPVPPRLVNDYTSTLSVSQAEKLERKLVAYNDSTSTQIAVVLVGSLDGYPIADYAHALAESWGVGGRQGTSLKVTVSVVLWVNQGLAGMENAGQREPFPGRAALLERHPADSESFLR